MRVVVLLLMLAVSVFGIVVGFRLILGRDLLNLENLPWVQAEQQPVSESALQPAPAPSPTLGAPTAEAVSPQMFNSWWAQTHVETDLWSGTDVAAVSFGKVPKGSYFRVVAPQEGARFYVFNPLTQNYAYIDASAVGPSSAPPEQPAAGQGTMVVANTGGLGVYVRRSPDTGDKLRAWREGTPMEVLEQGIQSGGRQWTKVRSPDGAEGYVPSEYLRPR